MHKSDSSAGDHLALSYRWFYFRCWKLPRQRTGRAGRTCRRPWFAVSAFTSMSAFILWAGAAVMRPARGEPLLWSTTRRPMPGFRRPRLIPITRSTIWLAVFFSPAVRRRSTAWAGRRRPARPQRRACSVTIRTRIPLPPLGWIPGPRAWRIRSRAASQCPVTSFLFWAVFTLAPAR
jgi:hypothetical protein